MYRIIKNGVQIGLTEHPTYVELLDNGSYGLCDEAQAHGIAYEGRVYSLAGKPAMKEVETVTLIHTDIGAVLSAQDSALRAASNDMSDVEVALCELDKKINGVNNDG